MPNNGITTWIIQKSNRNSLEKKQAYFNETLWGNTADNEVMANFLYALTLWQPKKYQNLISKGCEYLLTQQHKCNIHTYTHIYAHTYIHTACHTAYIQLYEYML